MVEIIEIANFEEKDIVILLPVMSLESLENMAEAYSEPFIFHYRFDYYLLVRGVSRVVFYFHDKEERERA